MVQTPVGQVSVNDTPCEVKKVLSQLAIELLIFLEQLSKEQCIYVHDLFRNHPNRRQSMLDAITELRLNQCIIRDDLIIKLTDKAKAYLDFDNKFHYSEKNQSAPLGIEKIYVNKKESIGKDKQKNVRFCKSIKQNKDSEIVHVNTLAIVPISKLSEKNLINNWM